MLISQLLEIEQTEKICKKPADLEDFDAAIDKVNACIEQALDIVNSPDWYENINVAAVNLPAADYIDHLNNELRYALKKAEETSKNLYDAITDID